MPKQKKKKPASKKRASNLTPKKLDAVAKKLASARELEAFVDSLLRNARGSAYNGYFSVGRFSARKVLPNGYIAKFILQAPGQSRRSR